MSLQASCIKNFRTLHHMSVKIIDNNVNATVSHIPKQCVVLCFQTDKVIYYLRAPFLCVCLMSKTFDVQ